MKFEPFLLERFQSLHEHYVDVNLSESGVEPLTVRELLEDDPAKCEQLLSSQLIYTQTNGTPELRGAIAAMYPDATVDHIEVTNGGSEANYLAGLHWIQPGDHVVMMIPNYMQYWGLLRGLEANVERWELVPDADQDRWRPDLDALDRLVRTDTKAIIICNPNNPTGSCLTAAEVEAVCQRADKVGAWVLSDEIYRGAELSGDEETPTAWGRYERVAVTSGLSKAYGLPGLRIGWLVAPPSEVEACWGQHDYTTIAPGALSDQLATIALQPERRKKILQRTRSVLRENLQVVCQWLDEFEGNVDYLTPQAGAMMYLRYHFDVNSSELARQLRFEESVLVVAGDHYGMDGYLRIGYGAHLDQLQDGLNRVRRYLAALK